jgi:hypothetical protein
VLVAGEADELLVEVPAATTLRGRVVDSEGVPAPGAQVRAWAGTGPRFLDGVAPPAEVEATTSADGTYELGGLGAQFWVCASAPGLVSTMNLRGAPKAPRDLVNVDFELFPPRTIVGSVRTADGTPIADAEITAMGGRGGRVNLRAGPDPDCPFILEADLATRSRADGTFRLEGSPPVQRSIRAAREGFQQQIRPAPVDVSEVNFVLAPPAGLEVRVVDDHGRPIEGAIVQHNTMTALATAPRTDAAGVARCPLVRDDFEFLRVQAPGYATELRFGRQGEGVPPSVLVQLAPERPLRVRVVDGSGNPPLECRIEVRRACPRALPLGDGVRAMRVPRAAYSLCAGFTDVRGEFAAARLPRSELELLVQPLDPPGVAEFFEVAAQAESIELRLGSGMGSARMVTGRILDADSQTAYPEPSKVFVTALELVHPMRIVRGVVDADGNYRVALPSAGPWYAAFQAPGRALARIEAEFPAAATHADVVLHAARDVRVRVVDPRGAPLGGGLLLVTDASGRPVPMILPPDQGASDRTLDTTGEITLQGLPATDVQLALFPWGLYPVQHVTLNPAQLPTGEFEWIVDLDGSTQATVAEIRVARLDQPRAELDDTCTSSGFGLAPCTLRLVDDLGRELLAWELRFGPQRPLIVSPYESCGFLLDGDSRISSLWGRDGASDGVGLRGSPGRYIRERDVLQVEISARAALLEVTGAGIEPLRIDLRQAVAQSADQPIAISIQPKRE